MLWILISLLFFWLIYRELTSHLPISKYYLLTLIIIALSCAWQPYKHWRFERLLTDIARRLAENKPANVHCNTLFDTLFDEQPRVAGHADLNTGYIVMQYPQCSVLMGYLDHPEQASMDELFSLGILTHESMHARGEHDEAKTECQAVQRNYRTARLLGVPDSIAKKNAQDFYKGYYLLRTDGYFSKDCAPGKAMDENLGDSTWNGLSLY